MTGHTDSIPATITVVGPMIRRTADTAAPGESMVWTASTAETMYVVRARGWTPNRQSTVLTGAMLSAVEVG